MYLISLNVRCLALKHSKVVRGLGSCCDHITECCCVIFLLWKQAILRIVSYGIGRDIYWKSQNLRKIRDNIFEQRLSKRKVVTPNQCVLSSYTVLISLTLPLIFANLFYCFEVLFCQNPEYFYDSLSVSTLWTATIVWVAKHFQFD